MNKKTLGPNDKTDREARLRAALRANLQRRKAQARDRAGEPTKTPQGAQKEGE